jgi:hypothetical protein
MSQGTLTLRRYFDVWIIKSIPTDWREQMIRGEDTIAAYRFLVGKSLQLLRQVRYALFVDMRVVC